MSPHSFDVCFYCLGVLGYLFIFNLEVLKSHVEAFCPWASLADGGASL